MHLLLLPRDLDDLKIVLKKHKDDDGCIVLPWPEDSKENDTILEYEYFDPTFWSLNWTTEEKYMNKKTEIFDKVIRE